MRLLAVGLLWLTLAACAATPPSSAPVEKRAEPAAAPPAPAAIPGPAPPLRPPSCQRIVHIEVLKSERRLRARCERGAVVEMTVALGREPRGPKREANDLRTPEGLYRVSDGSHPSRFHAFLPIDYPNVEDADRALDDGRIDRRDHARILEAHTRHLTPPADTPLGGAIGFHGEGDRWAGDSVHLDWTFGCIAVPDDELDFLIGRVAPGVPVLIRP